MKTSALRAGSWPPGGECSGASTQHARQQSTTLAITLAALGSKPEARSMLLEVLEARQRVLGPDHS